MCHSGRCDRRMPSSETMRYAAAFLLTLLIAGPGGAESDPPARSTVIAMAQHFVQEHFMFGASGHYHIEFDVTYLHPQPEPNFWAVVGGFVSDQNNFNTYVAAVRLICPESAKVTCWRLEKLAINGKILLNRSDPL